MTLKIYYYKWKTVKLFNVVQLITMYMYRNLFKIFSYIKFFMTFASVLNTVVNLEMSFSSVSIP